MKARSRFKLRKEPVLEWSLLRFGEGNSKNEERTLASDAQRPCQARYAIFLALRELGLEPGDEVLAPSYVCAAAVNPILAYGCQPAFYPITAQCEIHLSQLESKIHSRTRAVLAVHYFGFPDPNLQQLRDLCNRRNLLLIEDCAHVLWGEWRGILLGKIGDASVFSYRKFLPIPDGAGLRLSRSGVPAATRVRREPYRQTLKHAINLAEGRWPRLSDILRPSKPATVEVTEEDASSGRLSHEGDFDPLQLDRGTSRVSQWVLKHTQIEEVVRCRRRNYLELSARLQNIPGAQLLFPELPAGVCPWTLPLRIDGQPLAHRALRRMGIPAVAWDAMRPPELEVPKFPDAGFLYDNLFFLPVHQSLAPHDIDAMVAAVAQVGACTPKREAVCSVG